MSDTVLSCPNCRQEIPLSEALTGQLRSQVEAAIRADHEARLRTAVAAADSRAKSHLQPQLEALTRQLNEQTEHARAAEAHGLTLKRRALELEKQSETLAERVRIEVEDKLRQEAAQKTQQLVEQAEMRVRKENTEELKSLERQLSEQQEKARQAQAAELALRREKRALEERARELDLEVARKLAAEKQRLEEAIHKSAAEEQSLKLKEKEKQIDDLRKALEDARRKSQQGSQETQGEVLEMNLESVLTARFPADDIKAVKRGARGADLIQVVRNGTLEPCGTIIWEAKNAKNWSPAWIAKFKDDQREAGACLAVLVATMLPEGIRGFGCVDGVWVADLASYPALAVALRQQLIEVVRARAVSSGVSAKMELLYNYLSGHEFRHRVEAIVEAFTAMQVQIRRERRAMEKQWAEREKQIERVVGSTTGMYGALAGILGQALPSIPALEMSDTPLLEEQE